MCLPTVAARANECAVTESRSTLGSMTGVYITSVDIVSGSPDLPGPLGLLSALHISSQQSIIRRQLLFAVGDTVDSLRISETLRRLRAQRLFADAVIMARRCDPNGGVALTVTTRDTWTFRPTARLKSGNQLSIGMEEKNFLGTNRQLALTREFTPRGNGAAMTLVDPFLFGQDISGNLRLANLAGGHTVRVGLRRHEYSVFDNWKVEGNISRVSYGDTIVGERALHTISLTSLVGRRISESATSASLLLAGFSFDSAASISPSIRNVAVGTPHVRSYLGLDLGFQRRTAQFDTAGWIVPGRGFLDVPVGWETETLLGAGYERDAQAPALKLDGWLGRVFLPSRGSILMVDGWASGYFGNGNIDRNRILRSSLTFYNKAMRGMWGLRVTGEELLELDPDRRNLSLMPLADYTTPMLGIYTARGGRTVAGSIDRDVRLFSAGAASVVNLGGFLAGSYRWNVMDVPGEQLKAAAVGGRLRILSANGAINSIRVDVGYPIAHSGALSNKPFVVITYGTLFDVGRQRDGRRL